MSDVRVKVAKQVSVDGFHVTLSLPEALRLVAAAKRAGLTIEDTIRSAVMVWCEERKVRPSPVTTPERQHLRELRRRARLP